MKRIVSGRFGDKGEKEARRKIRRGIKRQQDRIWFENNNKSN